MNISDSYKSYAVDCVRLADREASPEAKKVMLNMALCWVKLAEQKKALAQAEEPADEATPDSRPDNDPPAKARPH